MSCGLRLRQLILLVLLLSPSLIITNQTKNDSSSLVKLARASQEIDGPSFQNLTYEITNYTDGSNDAVTIVCECSMLSNDTQPAWQEHYLGNYLANRFEWNGENFNYTYSINPFLKSFNITVILYDDMNNNVSEQVQVDYVEGKDLIRNTPPEEFPDLTETSDTSVYVGQNATMIWYVMDNALGLEVLMNGIVMENDFFINETPYVLQYDFTPQEVRIYSFSVRGYIEGTPFNASSSLFVIEGYQQLMALSITGTTGQTDPNNQFPADLIIISGVGLLGVIVLILLIRRR